MPRFVGPAPWRVGITDGWIAADLLPAIGAVAAVSVVTLGLAFGLCAPGSVALVSYSVRSSAVEVVAT